MYTTYGLITAVITTFTILCVTIQRRHLMVNEKFFISIIFFLPISKYLMPVYNTKCILILNFAGLGLICSEVCFRCLWTCSYRRLDLFGLNLLFWSREWWWSGTEIIRLLNNTDLFIYLFLPLLLSFHSIILCWFTLDWYWFCLFNPSTTVKVFGSSLADRLQFVFSLAA